MNNKNALIPINNSRWYKIKRFFRIGKHSEYVQQPINYKTDEEFENNIIVKEETNPEKAAELLAQGLMAGETNVNELSGAQLDEMILYFKGYVKSLEEELENINSRILEFQKEQGR